MVVAGRYSFNKGLETVKGKYAHLLEEIVGIITKIDAAKCKTKWSKEKTMPGRMLYSPKKLNVAFRSLFLQKDWFSPRSSASILPISIQTTTHLNRYEKAHFVKWISSKITSAWRFSLANTPLWFTTSAQR